jgi:hypothetical protein
MALHHFGLIRLSLRERVADLQSLTDSAMALGVICAFLLAFGGARMLVAASDRRKGALMLVTAAVLLANVVIWTL